MTTAIVTGPREDLWTEARFKLVAKQPFFASLVLHLMEREIQKEEIPFIFPQSAPTAAMALTDAGGGKLRPVFLYWPDFVRGLNRDMRQGLLCHEILHLAMKHLTRMGSRDPLLWNIACDYVVNLIVRDAGLTLPPDGLLDEQYRGMSAERVYELLVKSGKAKQSKPDLKHPMQKKLMKVGGGKGDKSKPEQASKQEAGDAEQEAENKKNDGQPKPGDGDGQPEQGEGQEPSQVSKEEMEAMEQEWQNNLIKAVMQAKMAGRVPGGLDRLVQDLIAPKIPWQRVIEQYLDQMLHDDYDENRFDKRFLANVQMIGADGQVSENNALYFPTLYSEGADIAFYGDTSGSIGQPTLYKMACEMAGILWCRNVAHFRVMAGDTRVTLNVELTRNDPIPTKFPGGGGTDFRPAFEAIDNLETKPKLLIFATDLEGTFPDVPPDYAVIWLVVDGSKASHPFGQRIDYEEENVR